MKTNTFVGMCVLGLSGLASASTFELSGVTQLSAGANHVCAVVANAAKCWGSDSEGQLGSGSRGAYRNVAGDVVTLHTGVAVVAAGGAHSCAIVAGGGVKCWGDNSQGQLGNGGTTDSPGPVDVQSLPWPAAAITAGHAHTCAISALGAAMCWGHNASGQLGDGTTSGRLTPTPVSGLTSGIVAISAAVNHTCAISAGGALKCWGANQFGQVGDGTAGGTRLVPVDVASGVSFVDTAGDVGSDTQAPQAYTCAIVSGVTKCWGSGRSAAPADATEVAPGASAVALGADRLFTGGTANVPLMHACVIAAGGGVRCWGSNWCGGVGDGAAPACGPTFATVAPAVDVVGLGPGVAAISAASTFTCALKDTRVKCWGAGYGSTAVAIMQGTIPQPLSFSMTPPPAVGGTASATVLARGASGESVIFRSLTPAVCAVDGTTVTGVAGGCCTIAADQLGNPYYEQAKQARMTFTVDPRRVQSINLTAPASLTVEGLASLAASSSSGRPVTLSLFTTSSCSLSGSFLRGIVAGACPVQASLPGDATYAPAHCVAREIPVVAGSGTRGLAIRTSGGGTGTVVSSPAGISCGASCAANFATGANVTLTATPAAGSTFAGWSGPCAASGASCVVGMDAVKEVGAHFGSDTPRLTNVSTRGWVAGGNDALIGGFVIGGSGNKTVIIRARGPSLAAFGISNALLDPSLRLVRSSDQAVLAYNENMSQETFIPNDGNIAVLNAAAIQSLGFGVSNANESALLATLPPGGYTALVSPSGSSAPGIGIFEVFEVDAAGQPLVNVSTRGRVGSGNDALIAGFVIQGNGPQTVVVRGRGPSLTAFGVTNALANPTLQLVRSSDQASVAANDNWGDAGNAAAITASGFAPSSGFEAAILVTLQPGAYTAILSGVGGGVGTGIVEVFRVGS